MKYLSMKLLGVLFAVFSDSSVDASDYDVTCGQVFSNERFTSYVNSFSRDKRLPSTEGLEHELAKCPRDQVLARIAFLSHLKSRQCKQANDLLSEFRTTSGNWHFSELEAENVAICFYENGEYAAAVKVFSTMDSVASGAAEVSTQYVYAESLYGSQDIDRAISVLRSVTKKNYESIQGKVDQIAYLNSLIAMARMLHIVGDFAESFAAANRAWAIDAGSTESTEIALASAARLEGLNSTQLRTVYCRAMSLRLAIRVDSLKEVEEDLKKIRSRILGKSESEIDCSSDSPM